MGRNGQDFVEWAPFWPSLPRGADVEAKTAYAELPSEAEAGDRPHLKLIEHILELWVRPSWQVQPYWLPCEASVFDAA